MQLEDMRLYVLMSDVMKLPYAAASSWQRGTWQTLNEQRMKEENALHEKEARGTMPSLIPPEDTIKRLNEQLCLCQKELQKTVESKTRLVKELKAALAKVHNAESTVLLATASRADVWFWDGDKDALSDLTCPVVMNHATLLDLLTKANQG